MDSLSEQRTKTFPLSSQDVVCPKKCGYSAKPANLRRHLLQKHRCSESDIKKFNEDLKAMKAKTQGTDIYRCNVCDHLCSSKKGLLTHQRNEHKTMVNPSDVSLFDQGTSKQQKYANNYEKCDKSGYTELTILKTKEVEHTKKIGSKNGQIPCSFEDCECKLATREEYCKHLNFHGEEYLVINESFDSKEKMEAWKIEELRASCTSFKIRDSEKDGNRTVQHFICQHEGGYERTGSHRHGHDTKKVTGNKFCTAFLKVVNKGANWDVTGCFKHRDHDLSYALQKLSDEENKVVVSLMKEDFTNRQILKKLEKRYTTMDRLFFVTDDDLRQIRKTEGLYDGRFDTNDLESIRKRFEMKNPDDGIQFFQPPKDETGEGFKLIIITPKQLEMLKKYGFRGVTLDDTHHATKYNLKLTTMLILDGRDRGYPVGYMLSSTTTGADVAQFFEVVRTLYPDFHPKYLMSDEAAVFWNGFKQVFPGTSTLKIICRWHVFRAWKKNAEKHLKDDSGLGQILMELRGFLYESNLSELRSRINNLLDMLENTDVTSKEAKNRKSFADYMRTYNLSRIEEWSVPFREGTPFNTSMYAEAWHSILKKQVLQRQTNIRIDTLCHQLLEAFEFILLKNQKQVARNLARACPRKIESRKRCRRAQQQKNNYLIFHSQDGTFKISNKSTELEEEYVVTDSLSCQCHAVENVHCDCGACPYRFSCSCPDNQAGVVCKHTHMVFARIRDDAILEAIGLDDEGEGEESGQLLETFGVPFEDVLPADRSTRHANITTTESSSWEISEREKREDINSKLYQRLVNSCSLLQAHARKLVKDSSEASTSQLEAAIRAINLHLPSNNNSSVMPLRNNPASRANPATARQTMNKITLKPRKRHQPQPFEGSSNKFCKNREICICDICHMPDPPLPVDIDADEEEARITLWKRCERCKLVVHMSCALNVKNCLGCDGKYVCYEMTEDEESDDFVEMED